MLKKVIKITACLLAVIIAIPLLFIAYMTAVDYQPADQLPIEIKYDRQDVGAVALGKPISVLTFNIGYCGLDKAQDFFLDGGTKSHSSSRAQTQTNLHKISYFISSRSPDAILLQEVDLNSSRSFHINEYEYLGRVFRGMNSTLGINYRVPWVPVPLSDPMGSVFSGLATFTKYNIASSTRYQYPGSEPWPTQLFELDRCFVENRLPIAGGKALVLLNSHLSAYDKGGVIRKKQLEFLKAYIISEFAKGNYVIVGGDWNHSLPGTDPGSFKTNEQWPDWLQKLPGDFTPAGFKWGVDRNVPTNRTIAKAYVKNENFTSVIDGFLVSPNVEIQSITGYDLGFENSDHNPVTGVFILK